ncbi:hypothetical protein Ocin01_00707 [Orchesella cincta]|uniref:Uncharacterized protein n=1 Tax=Orchesella cincta TaxID=48709 RepID=A0A1D2NL20_ORCCI|nr:hypothetical protein Ocin01_00707 [Orchesella cincta]
MENKPQFPLPVMPRMGRRNAIAFPDIHNTLSSDAAFSPVNLMQRASTEDYNSLDPDGVLAKQLKQERLRRLTSNGETLTDSPIPLSSMNDTLNNGWTKLLEASNNYNKFVDGLGIFDNKDSTKVQEKLDVLATKQLQIKQAANVIEGDRFGATRISPIIPWRKPDVIRHITPAEERQKMFESFNNTSFEPTETPPISESKLKKSSKRRSKSKGSQESMASTRSKQAPDPYSYIQPKVDTGMRYRVVEESSQDLRPHRHSSIPETGGNSARRNETKLSVKSAPGSSSSKKKPSVVPAKGATVPKTNKFISHRTIKNQLTAEPPKDNRLPLTIGPRYNHKKAWGLNKDTKNRAELVTDVRTRLYQSTVAAQQKWKFEPKPTSTNTLRSTFLNLQKINSGLTNRRLNPSHLNGPVPKETGTGSGEKRISPILQTIQAPPSPFLMSTLSIPGQVMPIPMNGEPPNSKTQKVDPKAKKGKGNATTKENKPLKVIPALGRAPNKYNNIYIGPYSGSDSEGDLGREVQRPKKL